MAKSKKKNAAVIEQTEPAKTEPTVIVTETKPASNPWRAIAIVLIILFIVPKMGGCALDRIKDKFSNLNPFGWFENVTPPTPPNPFKRERKTRPDTDPDDQDNDSDRRGIIWRFTRGAESARTLAAWVKKNVPSDAKPSVIYDVADAFYDAADKIEADKEIDEPNEAVAVARLGIFAAADSTWTPFLIGLDEEANTYGVESIQDVTEFYYAVADALYDAAASVSAAVEPSATEDPGQEPPSDAGTLPPSDSPAAPETGKDCKNGNCNRGYYPANYNYGYGYGWRWY